MQGGQRIAIAAGVGTIALVAGTVLAFAAGQPDGSAGRREAQYAEATGRYGDLPPCPSGKVEQVVKWETVVTNIEKAQEEAPPGVDLGADEIPRVDQLWVIPDNPQEFVDKVPAGATLVVSCVEVAPGDLRLLDGDGVFLGGNG